jgi:trigger factor
MDVTVNDISSVKKKLAIKIDAETIKKKLEGIYNRLRKKAKIKGFRPGKAPLNLIRRLYREQARVEAVEDLLQEGYSTALAEKELTPLAQPEIENLDFPEDESMISFEATIEIAPVFEIENYDDIKLEKPEVKVTDEEVESELDKLRSSMAQYKTIDERPAREGDVLVIDFVGRIDGEEFEGGKAEDFTIEIGSGRFIPELEAQLAGLESGQSYDLKATFPEDYHKEELAGKAAVFTVTVKAIREKELPELDDDLAIQISGGEIETLAELREKMTEYVTSSKEAEARSRLVEELMTALREKVDFELPECLVKDEEESALMNMRSRLMSQGFDQEMIEQLTTANREKMAEEAKKTVKNTLILEYLARREKIESTPEEVSAAFQRFLQRTGENPQNVFERFKGRESELTGMLQRDVIIEKTINFMLEKATGGSDADVGEASEASEAEAGEAADSGADSAAEGGDDAEKD